VLLQRRDYQFCLIRWVFQLPRRIILREKTPQYSKDTAHLYPNYVEQDIVSMSTRSLEEKAMLFTERTERLRQLVETKYPTSKISFASRSRPERGSIP
jgi:hypothetical protein